MYYTYVLYSLKDKKLYIGSTGNLKKRLKEHLEGKVFSTKGRLPLKLVFYEAFIKRNDAIRREKYFKTNPGKRSLRLMTQSYWNLKDTAFPSSSKVHQK